MHVPELQQPAHELPPQEQAPPAQDAPALHMPQATPPLPHADGLWPEYGTQVAPWQQPSGHEAGSHTHCPLPLHSCPGSHEPHAAPAAPHTELDCSAYGWQRPVAPPLQHPTGQLLASHAHTPLVVSQRSLTHGAHTSPPWPHWLADCEAKGTHVVPLQHPSAHVTALHAHGAPEPHASAPPASVPASCAPLTSGPGASECATSGPVVTSRDESVAPSRGASSVTSAPPSAPAGTSWRPAMDVQPDCPSSAASVAISHRRPHTRSS
jgi:hypothetical protein